MLGSVEPLLLWSIPLWALGLSPRGIRSYYSGFPRSKLYPTLILLLTLCRGLCFDSQLARRCRNDRLLECL